MAVEVAAAAPAAGVEPEASSRAGTAQRIDVLGDVARAHSFTPPLDGTAATWR